MDEVFQCVAPTLCLDSGKHAVASSRSSWVFLENKKMNPVMAASCPYSIFDHVMEMLKSGIKLNSSHYFCRGCKKTQRKSIIPKCSICKSDVKMCQAWLVAALSGGFQDLYSGLSSEISSTKDHRSQQKSWLNLLLGKLLGFLTEGKPVSANQKVGQALQKPVEPTQVSEQPLQEPEQGKSIFSDKVLFLGLESMSKIHQPALESESEIAFSKF